MANPNIKRAVRVALIAASTGSAALYGAATVAQEAELEQVIAVHYGQDLSYERTAEVLGVPRATVQSRLRRALRRLHRVLTRAGVRP